MFGFSTDCKKDIKINIMLNALMEDNSFYVKTIKCIKCTANSINVRMKDRFDNYHLTKIDCDFPTLVESLNF